MDFPCDFIAVRESYSPPENPASILLRLDWGRTKLAARCRHFREKSRCAAMTFRRISIEIRILYVHFGKCLSDVGKIAFSAFRTRFSASEYTYTTPPKIESKSSFDSTTFGGAKCGDLRYAYLAEFRYCYQVRTNWIVSFPQRHWIIYRNALGFQSRLPLLGWKAKHRRCGQWMTIR